MTQEAKEEAGPLRYEAASHSPGTTCILSATPFLDTAKLSTRRGIFSRRKRLAPRRGLEPMPAVDQCRDSFGPEQWLPGEDSNHSVPRTKKAR